MEKLTLRELSVFIGLVSSHAPVFGGFENYSACFYVRSPSKQNQLIDMDIYGSYYPVQLPAARETG